MKIQLIIDGRRIPDAYLDIEKNQRSATLYIDHLQEAIQASRERTPEEIFKDVKVAMGGEDEMERDRR